MSFEVQDVREWLEEQIMWGHPDRMSWDGFMVVRALRKMFDLYDENEGEYHN